MKQNSKSDKVEDSQEEIKHTDGELVKHRHKDQILKATGYWPYRQEVKHQEREPDRWS